MKSPNHLFRIGSLVRTLSAVSLLAAVCMLTAPSLCLAEEDPVPAPIKDIKLGMKQAQVIDMIKGDGKYTVSTHKKRTNRKIVDWELKPNPYYQKVQFRFSEKDRLYMLRFQLLPELRWGAKALKKSLFERFGVSWDYPGRIRRESLDAILYIPSNGQSPHFFEITNIGTGDKWFEIFDSPISAADRQGQDYGDDAKVKAASGKKGPDGPKPATPAAQAPSKPGDAGSAKAKDDGQNKKPEATTKPAPDKK